MKEWSRPRLIVVAASITIAALVLAASFVFPQGRPDTERAELTRDFLVDVVLGRVDKHFSFHKFGAAVATTTLKPVTQSGEYHMPAAPVSLEVLSDSASDDVGGIGAQEVIIYGLKADWTEEVQVVALDGLTPVAIPTDLLRLYFWAVIESGIYADEITTSSQVGNLTIREAGGGDVWSVIPVVAGIGAGRARIGAISVPAGVTAYLESYSVTVDSTKLVSVYLFHRAFADDVTPPYSGALRIIRELIGISGPWAPNIQAPVGPFVGPCDLGFAAIVPQADGAVAVDFEMLYIED